MQKKQKNKNKQTKKQKKGGSMIFSNRIFQMFFKTMIELFASIQYILYKIKKTKQTIT